jgi:hypothetical protein
MPKAKKMTRGLWQMVPVMDEDSNWVGMEDPGVGDGWRDVEEVGLIGT